MSVSAAPTGRGAFSSPDACRRAAKEMRGEIESVKKNLGK